MDHCTFYHVCLPAWLLCLCVCEAASVNLIQWHRESWCLMVCLFHRLWRWVAMTLERCHFRMLSTRFLSHLVLRWVDFRWKCSLIYLMLINRSTCAIYGRIVQWFVMKLSAYSACCLCKNKRTSCVNIINAWHEVQYQNWALTHVWYFWCSGPYVGMINLEKCVLFDVWNKL